MTLQGDAQSGKSMSEFKTAHTISAIMLLCIAAGALALPNELEDLLMYKANAIYPKEWWRFFTSHWLHLSAFHLGLNLSALAIYFYLFPRSAHPKCFWPAILVISPAISACLLLFATEVNWYVGLSGVIVGLFAYSAVCSIQEQPVESFGTLSVLSLKLVLENISVDMPTENLIRGRVITEAHLYGFLVGILYGYLNILFHIGTLRNTKELPKDSENTT